MIQMIMMIAIIYVFTNRVLYLGMRPSKFYMKLLSETLQSEPLGSLEVRITEGPTTHEVDNLIKMLELTILAYT